MGSETNIAWCDATFNPWWGCARVSPGCEHCYAEAFAKRTGNAVWGANAPRRFFGLKHYAEPRRWNEKALREGRRARVFCASMADVFERLDGDVGAMLDAERAHLWTTIEQTPALDWLLLTKRPANMVELLPPSWLHAPRRNVWLGVTAEDQKRADERVPILLATPAAIRFVSAEPLLGPVNLCAVPDNKLRPCEFSARYTPLADLDWVIVGGESGPGARPFDLAWARSLRDLCKEAGVAYFFKQTGAHPYEERPAEGGAHGTDEALAHLGAAHPQRPWFEGWTLTHRPDGTSSWIKHHRPKDRKGGDPEEWPADLRVREFPEARA